MNELYDWAKSLLLSGRLDLVRDALKVALLRSTYQPEIDLHKSYADIAPHCCQARQFDPEIPERSVAHGVLLGGPVTFPVVESGQLCKFAALYRDGSSDAESDLVLLVRAAAGIPLQTTGADVTLEWSPEGILSI